MLRNNVFYKVAFKMSDVHKVGTTGTDLGSCVECGAPLIPVIELEAPTDDHAYIIREGVVVSRCALGSAT